MKSGFAYFCTMGSEKKFSGYLSSFFREEVIERFNSNINPIIEVAIINGRYQLNAGRVNYSYGPLHDAFRKYFHKDHPTIDNNSKVLVLGLGGGSVVKILQDEYNINCRFTGVDADPAVIDAANKYFGLAKVPNLEVIVDDAYDFITDCSNQYDLIVVDIYIDDCIPRKFETLQFIRLLSNCLRKDGKVVYNKLQHSQDESGLKKLTNYFRTVFTDVKVHKVSVNKITPNYFITASNIE